MAPMINIQIRQVHQRSEGQAMVLAIGTANPPNVFYQADYPDYYFRVTKSEHLTELKSKFRRICTFNLSIFTVCTDRCSDC